MERDNGRSMDICHYCHAFIPEGQRCCVARLEEAIDKLYELAARARLAAAIESNRRERADVPKKSLNHYWRHELDSGVGARTRGWGLEGVRYD